ncbi:carbohydrate porin [Alkalilimnicola ehrlichii]|uniref:carbohydrate porin n=1 Tax=Alkalilimnicola ehrlichii TaxID=351052 RepID=UPI001C6EFCE0|nr:carbohydrate porin [Alkalilimnicola ehrlichii]
MSDNWSGMVAAIYEDQRDVQRWYSVGARPVYHLNEYVDLMVEVGYDRVDPDDGSAGDLTKVTFAAALSPGMNFWARPSLRAFVTYASWSDEFRGRIGVDTPVENDRDAVTFGLQTEVWW